MKIYTKTGDTGKTGLFGGPRVDKCHPRVEAYGAVDELNAAIGAARAEASVLSGEAAQGGAEIDQVLYRIQNELFCVGAELATPNAEEKGIDLLSARAVTAQEEEIDRFTEKITPLKQFILPGGTRLAAALHLARAICRRAERHVVALSQLPDEKLSAQVLPYLNRLSDLLFVLARVANAAAGQGDVPWQKSGQA